MTSTSEAPQPRKRTTKRVTKTAKVPAKKAAAKTQAKPVEQPSPEVAAVIEQVNQAVSDLIAQHQAEPLLNGPATVILQMHVDFATTPSDAVNNAIGQLVDQGLTRWAWLVHDDDGKVHVVSDGRVLNEQDMESYGA